MSSIPQTYTVSDFIEWNNKNQLILSPDFQRGSVWTPAAKVFLIDTILNDLPIPQVYFRTKLDPKNQTTVREVVDGQQRLRAILEFAKDDLKLTSKSPKYKGKTYSNLDQADQESFLSYKIPVVQLLNASNADVLEVFARLNSYSVKVTPAELRHAEYIEPVKWAIYDATRDWGDLWNTYHLVGVRDSVRLKHTSVMAEMFMFLENGVSDAGEPKINAYYKSRKAKAEEYFTPIRKNADEIIKEIIDNLKNDFTKTTFFDAPNFLMLFAAIGYLKGYIPNTKATEGMEAYQQTGIDWVRAQSTLAAIAQSFDSDFNSTDPYAAFVLATKSSTHRVASRKTRITTLIQALSLNGAL